MEATLFNPQLYCGGEEIGHDADMPCPLCGGIPYPCPCGGDDDETETPLNLGSGGYIINQAWLQGEA